MEIQINTDNAIDATAAQTGEIEAAVRDGLSRFASRLTRVEVHFADENGPGSGIDDKRCMIEVRPAGQGPVAVTDQGGSMDRATSGALAKMTTALERTFGRQTDRKGH